jgi:hypothetical protein
MTTMIPDPNDLRAHFGRRCSSCRGAIMWAWTREGERMPIDAQPSEHGNVLAFRAPDNRRRLVVTVMGTKGDTAKRKLAAMRRAGWPTYTHHRVNCPQAEEWARSRGKRGRELKAPPAALPPTTSSVSTLPEQGTLL